MATITPKILKDKDGNQIFPITDPQAIPYDNILDPSVINVKSALDTLQNKTLPKGGNLGQILVKKTSSDYDVEWITGGGVIPDNVVYYEQSSTLPEQIEFISDDAKKLGGQLPSYYDNQAVSYINSLINIPKTQSFDILNLNIIGNTSVIPINPLLPISPDNVASIVSVGEVNLFDGTYLNNTFINLSGNLQASPNARTTNPISCLPNTTYTLSGGNRSVIRFLDKDNNVITVRDALTFTTPSNAVKFQAYYSLDGTHTQVQINYGAIALPYVPYGNMTITKCGKNLCPNIYNYNQKNGLYNINGARLNYTKYENGSVSLVGDVGTERAINIWYAGNYQLVYDVNRVLFVIKKGSTVNIKDCRVFGHIYGGLTSYENESVTFTEDFYVSGIRCVNLPINTQVNVVHYPQLELGTTPTPYEPYNGITYAIPLKDTTGVFIPLRKVGDIADKVFKDTDGIWKVKNYVLRTAFNGDGAFIVGNTKQNTIMFAKASSDRLNGSGNILSNRFTTQDIYDKDIEGIQGLSTSGNYVIRINKSRLTTQDVAGFKAWLQANPLEVIYQLATPIIITLHQDAQTQFDALEQMLEGETNIFGTDSVSPSFDGKYYKGSKNSELLGNQSPEYYAKQSDMYKTIRSIGNLSSIHDLNDFTTPAIYTCTDCVNRPTGSNFGLITIQSSGNYYGSQTYYDIQYYKTYVRYTAEAVNKSWTLWQEISTTETRQLTASDMLNGWKGWADAYYPKLTRSGNLVTITGAVFNANPVNNQNIIQLPIGFIPSTTQPAYGMSSTGPVGIGVFSTGYLVLDYSSNIGTATSNGLIMLNISYSLNYGG